MLVRTKSELTKKWASGEFSKDTEYKTWMSNHAAVATIQFIDQLLEIDFKELQLSEED